MKALKPPEGVGGIFGEKLTHVGIVFGFAMGSKFGHVFIVPSGVVCDACGFLKGCASGCEGANGNACGATEFGHFFKEDNRCPCFGGRDGSGQPCTTAANDDDVGFFVPCVGKIFHGSYDKMIDGGCPFVLFLRGEKRDAGLERAY